MMRLYLAIVISLLGHGTLLLPLTGPTLPEIPVAPMQVSLNPASPTHASREPAPDTARKPSHQPGAKKVSDNGKKPRKTETTHPQGSITPDDESTTQHHKIAQTETRDKQPTPVIPVSQELREQISRHHAQPQVISRLQQKLQNYFEYPLLARRNGWEGKVVLAMDIYVDGRIYNIQLKTGSGYKILDRSALKAVSRIRALPDLPDWQGNSPLNIHLPVIYRLQG